MNLRKLDFRSLTEVAMQNAPDNSDPILLPEDEVEKLFDSLGMPKFLNNTCVLVSLDTKKATGATELPLPIVYYFGRRRRLRSAWRREKFIRKLDRKTQAIVYWRRLANAEEERRVQQFTAPDGRFFVVESVKRSWDDLSSGSDEASS